MKTKIFLITPPFTQLNTPYPATAYLKGFLNTLHVDAFQADLGIEVILKLFSRDGLSKLFSIVDQANGEWSDNALRIMALSEHYVKTIDPVITFLQGKNPTLALQICQEDFLPEAARFEQLNDIEWAFGVMGSQDKAKHLATLYLEDISDFIVECVDEHFGFSRYAERLGRSANSFDEMAATLQAPPTYIDRILFEILESKFAAIQPDFLLISVPFPGNLYAAFRTAQWTKKHHPEVKIAMGGGFANTELRSLSDPRVFSYFDFVTLDDGELPVALLIENFETAKARKLNLNGQSGFDNMNLRELEYKRTFLLRDGKVVYRNNSQRNDYKQSEVGTPDYSDLLLDSYISVIEVVNPMHKMWSDGRWNKLTMAHGCYWGKCTFCDISLDYIKIYEPVTAKLMVDRMEILVAQTGETGFHFVDEAAPPALMRELALEILRRKLVVTWWTNIRFEKSFTADLCRLLRASGCIAVSGGLEVASDRLLKLIDKGVTVEQVARVTSHFTRAGIMVHAYLMYGYPTQTVQETIDSLEMVRQLFEQGVLQSGFWHQFAMTAHSPVGLEPEKFGVKKVNDTVGTFANNDLDYIDETGIDHQRFSFGLKKSLYNFMHGLCFDYPLQEWFDFKIPRTTVSPDFIENAIQESGDLQIKNHGKVIWLGGHPRTSSSTKKKKGQSMEMLSMVFYDKREQIEIQLEKEQGAWLIDLLESISVNSGRASAISEIKSSYEAKFENFELLWFSKPLITLRGIGLIQL